MQHPKTTLLLIAGALAAPLLAGCGGAASTSTSPSLQRLPLVAGGQIAAQARQCDRGANPFCALELVVVDRRFDSSGALVAAEHRMLRRAGWIDATGDFGQEQASDSPEHRLHVTYATALNDLTGVDEEWIKRPRWLAVALSREVFARVPAMAVTLQSGPA